MSILESIILGLLQGVTEFLPVSSSGHLAVVQHLFHLDEIPALFDVILHLPSLLAVIIFFRKKIIRLLIIFGRWITGKKLCDQQLDSSNAAGTETSSSPSGSGASDAGFDLLTGTERGGRRTIVAIILSTLVTGVIGVFSSKLLPELPVKAVFFGFLVTSALLITSGVFARRASMHERKESAEGVSVVQALAIGFMQGIGTLPGISRSGSTISGALFAGVNREAAGEYSFIVSIPAILGAFVLELKDAAELGSTVSAGALVCGCVASFVAAYLSLVFLMKIIRRGRLEWFAAYLIPCGILGLIFA